jgi:hypothetical protein
MKTNLIGLLTQAAACIDPAKDTGAYAYMLGEEVVGHLRDVKAGKHTIEEFAEFYCFAPEPPEKPA